MDKRKTKLTNILPFLACAAALLWLFYQLYPLLFATHDDMRNYTLVRRGILAENAVTSAQKGRISHLWNHFLLGFPFLLNKVWFYKLVQYGTLVFDLSALYLLLRSEVSRKFAALSVMLCSAWFCINANHNLLISYAFCHQLPVGLLLLSLYFFGKRLKSGKKRHTVLSCLFLLTACMIYEAFVAALLIFAVWSLLETEQKAGYFAYLRASAKRMLPQTGTAFFYCIVYFGWQYRYPSTYDGTSLMLKEPFVSLSALGTYSTSMLPTAELMRMGRGEELSVLRFCGHLLHPAAWVCAFLTAAAVFVLLPQIRIDRGKLYRILLVTGIGIPVPCLLISFSEKYIEWHRRGTTGYVPSFYSYFFLVAFLAAAGIALYRGACGTAQKKTVRGLLTAFVFGMTLCASCVNDMWKPHFENLLRHYRSFDRTISAAPFTDCDDSFQLYAPEHEGIHLAANYTQDYMKIYNPAEITFVNKEENLDPDKRILCVRTAQDDCYTVSGVTDSSFLTDAVTVRTLHTGTLTVQLTDDSGQPQTYENVRDGDVLRAPDGTEFDLRNSFPQP
ncbi:MAG: hypothetical protein IKG82_14250, partial [Oscillospiraceae bacterium]|nr:hypothetical protein [Oscillospiraceae bacterium]